MNPGLVTALRTNHALEHATIALLAMRIGVGVKLLGRATPGGFYIYGDAPTQMVEEAANEGLTRLQQGEADLAVSPFCGTNVVVAGVLAAISSLLVLRRKDGLRRLPRAIMMAMTSILLAQPLGGLVQKRLTTSGDLTGVTITKVTAKGKGTRTRHKIETARRLAG